jgi:hypothetical protein
MKLRRNSSGEPYPLTEKLTIPLQESLLALIALNSKQGHIAASMLSAKSFNEPYEDLAGRILDYHKANGLAPGKLHLPDLFDDILGNPKHKQYKHYLRTLELIFAAGHNLNPDYLLKRVDKFNERQKLKGAILDCIKAYEQSEEGVEDQVKAIMLKATRNEAGSLDVGVRLSDKEKALVFLDTEPVAFSIGIKEFTRYNLGLAYKRVLMMIGAKGSGKSWWCVHIGRHALMQKANVLHITLENTWEETIKRYFQNLWSIPEKLSTVDITKFKLDELGKLIGLGNKAMRAQIRLKDEDIRKVLGDKIDAWGARISGLIVREFPAGSLSMEGLEGFLDYLEVHEKFIPNVLIIDYLDLMQLEKGVDKRIALGNLYVQFRGLLQKRNLCGATPTQGNRDSWDASTVRASMISEDASKVNTADMTITYSRTEAEERRGLARLQVAHNRIGRDKYTVLITQNYAIGQFAMDSVMLNGHYKDILKDADADHKS